MKFIVAVAFCDKFELGKSVNTEQIAKIIKGRVPEIFMAIIFCFGILMRRAR